jgi:hypothetical protein
MASFQQKQFAVSVHACGFESIELYSRSQPGAVEPYRVHSSAHLAVYKHRYLLAIYGKNIHCRVGSCGSLKDISLHVKRIPEIPK